MNRSLDIDINFYKKYDKPEFLVTGFARSMTAWASVFLSTNGVTCIHEPESIQCYDPPIGNVAYSSSGLLMLEIPGDVKIAIISRDFDEAFDSFSLLFDRDISDARAYLSGLQDVMNYLKSGPNAMDFSFEALSNGSIQEARNLFYFCFGTNVEFDYYRAHLLLDMNIQSKSVNLLKLV